MKSQKFSIKKRIKSFSYAFNGLKIALKEEHNMRIHFAATVSVLVISFCFNITCYEWIAIIFAIGFVFAMELINSAIENTADFISSEKHTTIMKIKDLSAAAVLVSAFVALIIGMIIFLPKIWTLSIECKTQNLSYTNAQIDQPLLDSLEFELQKLKNQAFCDCFNQALINANAKITVPDGSNYIQISDLDINYFNNSYLKELIKDWNKKEYISYNEENKLYLMRCLDFYNSEDLELYIDSIRKIEIRKYYKH